MNMKNIIIAIVVIGLLVGAYFAAPYIMPSSPAPSSSLETGSGAALPGSVASAGLVSGGREFARILVNLEGLKLNERIFKDPLFGALVDFSVDLKPQVKGRSNPFAPLGSDGSVSEEVPSGQ